MQRVLNFQHGLLYAEVDITCLSALILQLDVFDDKLYRITQKSR